MDVGDGFTPTYRNSEFCIFSDTFDQVGNLTRALAEAGLADNTLILFTADNGGQTKK